MFFLDDSMRTAHVSDFRLVKIISIISSVTSTTIRKKAFSRGQRSGLRVVYNSTIKYSWDEDNRDMVWL